MLEPNKIYNMDCLEGMKEIPDKSIDVICCDLPYGTTPLQWDNVIDFTKLWEQYKRIIKDNGAIVLFGQEPFSSYVRLSNINDYRYDWIWVKEALTNVFQVKKRPGKVVENIMVFYKEQPTYNPQKTMHTGKRVTNKVGENAKFSDTQSTNSNIKPLEYNDDGTRYPLQVLNINRDNRRNTIHPTQKPVELIEYLVKTYSNEGDLILDNCIGSGTTGVACVNTNRRFIGMELNEYYCKVAEQRVNDAIEQKRKELLLGSTFPTSKETFKITLANEQKK